MRSGPSPTQRDYNVQKIYKSKAKQYIFAFEGAVTEPQYFDGIRKYAEQIGIDNAIIKCIPLRRSSMYRGCSNPNQAVIPFLAKCLNEFKNEVMSVETLVEHAIDWVAETHLSWRKRYNERYLLKLKSSILEKLKEDGCEIDKQIKYEDLNSIAHHIYETTMLQICENNSEEEFKKFIVCILDEAHSFTKGDKAFAIIDRDCNSYSARVYDEILKQCRDKNINLVVSNPQFEFWLLLHFTDAKDCDAEKLLNDKSYLLEKLQKKTGRSSKDINFEQYLHNVPIAIANEKLYEENPEKLRDRLGTNVGTLLEEMINKKAR